MQVGVLVGMPRYWVNHGLLTTLAEWWHSDDKTFHLSTKEMMITSKDVYRILHNPVMGELVVYDIEEQGGIEALRQIFDHPQIDDYSIPWQDMADDSKPLPSVLVGLIGGFLCRDR